MSTVIFVSQAYYARRHKPSKIIVIHAFIPGRTVIDNHSFSDVMRQHHTITQKFMVPALTTLYIEQVKKRFFETTKRQRLDVGVIQHYVRLWKSACSTNYSDCLYFTLLANQYIVSLPCYQTIFN